ncbi:MAG: hypothetical protein ACOC95_05380 [Planctomycetota bacterium]
MVRGPVLRFRSLLWASVAVTAVLVAVGSVVSLWHTGQVHAGAVAVGVVAALAPLLLVGWLMTVVAVRTDLAGLGRAFLSVRLTTFRISLALALLVTGEMLLSLQGPDGSVWFGALYISLLGVEAVWLVRAAARRGEGEGCA